MQSISAALKLRTPGNADPLSTGSSRPKGDKNAVVIAVAAQKGGVGKTTTSVALAAAWARFHDKRVLLVDLDPQGHVNLALADQVVVGGGALSEVLYDTADIEDAVTPTEIPNLFVTPNDPGLLTIEDRLSSKIGREMVLRKVLAMARTHYDLIVLDCPPNIGLLTLNALVAADQVLIPANPTALAVSGVSGLMDTMFEIRGSYNPALEVLGVALTRLDGRNSSTNDAIVSLVEENWGHILLDARIGVNNALSKAQLAGRDIFDVAPTSRGAQQYRALAENILEQLD